MVRPRCSYLVGNPKSRRELVSRFGMMCFQTGQCPKKTVPVEMKKGAKDVPVYALPKHVPEIAACGYGGATEVNVFVPFVGTWGH